MLLACPSAATTKRILFYEVGTATPYKIDSGYSQFAEDLKKEGYDVASISRGSLDRKALENYDILVIQNLNRKLETQEVSAILWFVIQRGRGLFINGEGSGNANQLTIPFGVTIDDGTLIDVSDQIGGNRKSFKVHRFYPQDGISVIVKDIKAITVSDARAFILSGDAKAIASGDEDTYSDTGSFAAGSMPVVSAATLFGDGLVFVHTDADTLSNARVGEDNNRKYGLNIINWLAISSQDFSISNDTENVEIEISRLKIKRQELENANTRLDTENTHILNQNSQLEIQISIAQARLAELEEGMVGPLNRDNWAILVLGLSILISAVIVSQRKKGGEVHEDVLSELGYEFDEGGDSGSEDDFDVEGLKL